MRVNYIKHLENIQFMSGPETEPYSTNDEHMTPKESRRRQDSAHWAAMSPISRALRNKRRCDSYVSKRLFKTPQEKVDRNDKQKETITRELRDIRRTICTLTLSPWQTHNLNQSFYSLLVISLPREY
jgi:hypothetical protein